MDFIIVEADGGAMAAGGAKTHEFQVVADNGEETRKYGSKLETVNISATFAGKTISSPEEVDQLIDKLKNKLMVELTKNGKIFLK